MATHADIPTPPATTPALQVLAISGSTRAASLNGQLLRAAAAALPPSVELVALDPALIKAIPAFDEDDEARAGGDDIPAQLGGLRRAGRRAGHHRLARCPRPATWSRAGS